MRKISLIVLMLGALSISVNACDEISFADVDVADAALNVALKKRGLPSEYRKTRARMESMFILGEISVRSPGLLEGKLVPCFDWPLYKSVVSRYAELSKKIELR